MGWDGMGWDGMVWDGGTDSRKFLFNVAETVQKNRAFFSFFRSKCYFSRVFFYFSEFIQFAEISFAEIAYYQIKDIVFLECF